MNEFSKKPDRRQVNISIDPALHQEMKRWKDRLKDTSNVSNLDDVYTWAITELLANLEVDHPEFMEVVEAPITEADITIGALERHSEIRQG